MTAETQASPPPAAKKTDSGYVVLAKDDSGLWAVEKTVQAKSAEAAVRAIGSGGTFVAIPARSFKPVKVFAKTETRLIVEQA